MLRYSTGMSYIRWRLVDGVGAEVFSTCLGCSEPGVQNLTKGGSYTLTWVPTTMLPPALISCSCLMYPRRASFPLK